MIQNLNVFSQKPTRVVLFGGSGFIGKKLFSMLKSNRVEVLSLGSQDLDLTETNAVKKIEDLIKSTDTIVFLSAITPDKSHNNDALIKNLLMTKHLCQALKNKHVNHLIYFSSDAVYHSNQSVVNEESLVAPQNLYGVMHLSREIMISELIDIPSIVLRVTMVYGFGDTHGSYGPNRFLHSSIKYKEINLFGCGEETRDHIHVDDVINITNLCINMRSIGVLNVATGKSNSFKNIAKIVSNLFSDKIIINNKYRINAITHRHYDVTNRLKIFPYRSFINIEKGLCDYNKKLLEI